MQSNTYLGIRKIYTKNHAFKKFFFLCTYQFTEFKEYKLYFQSYIQIHNSFILFIKKFRNSNKFLR